MAKDNDFGLSSNAGPSEVSQAAAVATIDRVANEAPPMSAGQGAQDNGVAQADGKQVDDKGLKKEFDLNEPNPEPAEGGEPEKVVEVDTDPEAAKPEPEVEPVVEPTGDQVEPIDQWLKDVPVSDRQDILSEFMTSNIDDLKVSVRQGHEDVEMTLGELKRAASGYAGEANAGRQIKQAKAEVAAREKALVDREKFISDQFEKPGDLMTFLDSNVTDPVAYFTAVKDHAEAVLAEAEENPGRFRRDANLRKENAELRSDIADIKDLLRNNGQNGKTGTPEPEVAGGTTADAKREEIRQEGERREKLVVKEGYQVDAIAKIWADEGRPDDFYRWFAEHRLAQERDTAKAKVGTTKENRRKGGAALRRRGSANPTPLAAKDDGKVLDAAGISEFLRNHPTNKGRIT